MQLKMIKLSDMQNYGAFKTSPNVFSGSDQNVFMYQGGSNLGQ